MSLRAKWQVIKAIMRAHQCVVITDLSSHSSVPRDDDLAFFAYAERRLKSLHARHHNQAVDGLTGDEEDQS